jgi:23S rRNA (guanosine2251-2'-O)-methyltransferase
MKGEGHERIYGRHPIHEALIAGRRRIVRILIAEGTEKQGIIEKIILKAASTHIPVDFIPREMLDQETLHHQGVTAEVSSYPYVSLQDILQKMRNSPETGLILLLDVLQDPQNLGTLLRTAEAVGVDGGCPFICWCE